MRATANWKDERNYSSADELSGREVTLDGGGTHSSPTCHDSASTNSEAYGASVSYRFHVPMIPIIYIKPVTVERARNVRAVTSASL